jgi:hypothetical protein
MRFLPVPLALAALAAVAAAPAATAQTGCDQSDPCPLPISVDEQGFQDAFDLNFTLGDWWELDFSNWDENASHTITLSGYGVSVTLGDFDHGGLEGKQQKVHFTKTGCFDLRDSPSNDVAKVRVYKSDTNDLDAGVTSEADPCRGGGGIPAPEWPVLIVVTAGLALLARRRA